MALHNATDCLRLLVIHGRRYQFVDRYESWVQYRSRRPLPRVDMRPLAEQLSNAERESDVDRVGAGEPHSDASRRWRVVARSALVRTMVVDHLRTSPPAWDPYSADAS